MMTECKCRTDLAARGRRSLGESAFLPAGQACKLPPINGLGERK